MEWKIASVAKRSAILGRPAVAAWMAARVAPTCAAKAGRASPCRKRSFHTGNGRYCIANKPARSSLARTRGAAPGAASPAVSSQSRSYRLRSTGASQRWETRRRGSARLTQTFPTFQISEDTPPLSASTGLVSSPAPRSRRIAASGRESLNGPSVAFTTISQTVVQAIRTALPELDFLRHDAIPAPVRGARRLISMLATCLFHCVLEDFPRGDGCALRRRPRGEPGAERARRIVGVRLGGSDFLHNAVDAHLALEVGPEQQQAGLRALLELAPFAA